MPRGWFDPAQERRDDPRGDLPAALPYDEDHDGLAPEEHFLDPEGDSDSDVAPAAEPPRGRTGGKWQTAPKKRRGSATARFEEPSAKRRSKPDDPGWWNQMLVSQRAQPAAPVPAPLAAPAPPPVAARAVNGVGTTSEPLAPRASGFPAPTFR